MLLFLLRNADAFKDPYGLDPPGATRGPDTADGGDTDLPRWDELNERWVPRLTRGSVETVMKKCVERIRHLIVIRIYLVILYVYRYVYTCMFISIYCRYNIYIG